MKAINAFIALENGDQDSLDIWDMCTVARIEREVWAMMEGRIELHWHLLGLLLDPWQSYQSNVELETLLMVWCW